MTTGDKNPCPQGADIPFEESQTLPMPKKEVWNATGGAGGQLRLLVAALGGRGETALLVLKARRLSWTCLGVFGS